MTETNTEVNTTETTGAEAVVDNGSVNLEIVDLQNAVIIIDAAAKRGAFEGPELEKVGKIRNKLARFADAAFAAQQQNSNPDATVTDASATEEVVTEAVAEKPAKRKASKK